MFSLSIYDIASICDLVLSGYVEYITNTIPLGVRNIRKLSPVKQGVSTINPDQW